MFYGRVRASIPRPWSILLAMVRVQRRRRGRTSGEGDQVPAGLVDEGADEGADQRADEASVEEVGDDLDDGPDEDLDEDLREEEPVSRTSLAAAAGVDLDGRRRFSPRTWTPLLLLQTTHPKQAVLTALVLGGVAVLTGRPPNEVGVIVCTVLVGQAMLGWHNDVVDRRKDHDNQAPRKPVADGRLDPGTVWYAIVVAFWVLLPLAVTTGITAGCIYLGSVAVGMLGNVLLRTGFLSWWSWAVSFAMLPAYLSYGGWGGQALGSPPEVSITVLAALLGIGVHFTRSVWGLVADHAEGWTYLPLKLGMKLGATRLLMLSTFYTVVVVALLVVFGARDGLAQ